MGKGDKKTRRGKIILGTFGVRRRRKTVEKPDIKPPVAAGKEVKEKKTAKEKAEVKEENVAAEVKESKGAKEKAAPRAHKAAKEKKEVPEPNDIPKAKKEKKS